MTRIYMLDTDTCSYIIRNNPPVVVQKIWDHRLDDIRISAVTQAELLYGARRKKSVKLLRQVEAFFSKWGVVPFDASAADAYADIRLELEAKGSTIGNMDILTAACARAVRAVLVTNNQKHFSQIRGLPTQNWVV